MTGSFPNEAVVKLAAEKLQAAEGQPVDPAQARRHLKLPTFFKPWSICLAGRPPLPSATRLETWSRAGLLRIPCAALAMARR